VRAHPILATAVAAALGLGFAPVTQSLRPVEPMAATTADDAAAAAALEAVRTDPATFGATAADVADLLVTDVVPGTAAGVTHVYLRQRLDGLEVNGADLSITMRDGEVFFHGSRFRTGLAAAASGRAVLSAADAVAAAARAVGLTPTAPAVPVASEGGVDRATTLTPAGIASEPIQTRLVRAEDPATGDLRVAWNVEFEQADHAHWWVVTVDAETGAELGRIDLVVHHDDARHLATGPGRTLAAHADDHADDHADGHTDDHADHADDLLDLDHIGPPEPVDDGASYRVFALPLESPNDGDRSLVSAVADRVGSPFGWHDLDGKPGADTTTTRGNNVHAYLDLTASTVTTLLDADGGPDLEFDFEHDQSDRQPYTYKDAAVTNLFYWNNVVHDVLVRYGFDEASGNFQEVNYTGLGLGGDSVRAEAMDGSGVNNANFATPAEGSRPRMQMYVFPNTGQRRIIDGDFDAGVIIHEYAHGISNRLTGGPSNVGCLRNAEQAGEGWSDWYAIAMTARTGDEGTDRRGIGTYVLGQASRSDGGIRPTVYSTGIFNQSTYQQTRTLIVPHGVGYQFASTLWEVYWALVDEHGFNPSIYDDWTTGGNNLAIQLVTDGLKMQACSPGFVDSRDAIIAADAALTGGENECLLWRAFAKRGLGVDAVQGSSTTNEDNTNGFALPPQCTA
jgi:hypothetical protein